MVSRTLWLLSCIAVFDSAHALSIEEAWQAAKANNPELEQAALNIEKQENALDLNRSKRLPSLSASANANWNQNGSTRNSLRATLDWTIWDSSLWTQLDSAEASVVVSKLELSKTRNELAKKLILAYFNVASAQGDLQLAENKLQETRKQRTIAEQRFKAGRVKSIDVEQVLANEVAGQSQILKSQSKLNQARLELQALILRDVGTVDQIRNDSLIEPKKRVESEPDWIKLAKDNSPELLVATQRIQVREFEKEIARSGYYPKLTSNLNYNQNGTDLSDNDVTAGLSLSIPIDLNGAIQNKVDTASLNIREAQLAMQMVEINIRKMVQRAYSHVDINWRQVMTTQALIYSREKVLKTEQTLYSAGMINVLRVIDAHNELYEAKHQLKNSLYEYWRQRVELLAVAGQLDDDTMTLISQALES
ncbi:Outer membrane protein tolC [Vibrio nigripulchritudo SFn27]|uniref:Outer membrane protein tolC n=2 Tax=Vibrio nigripulchritudo TaxID=28173 RepID=U4KIT1_9VIBR|nr:TolC family protein [Vibrio nigripulchritudo]CCN90375.1 Outer membrane protein tolC [Vibrio nigripulchritudo SFn27]CCO42879.1 Outer membrane protein tolC [Vibrio nigripulchritudo SFn135]CCO61220.1 Outer membrane protein tolC [Vibrio nigripulchritudo]